MQDPEIQNILTDPVMRQVKETNLKHSLAVVTFHKFMFGMRSCVIFTLMPLTKSDTFFFEQVLSDLQENPAAAQKHMQNPMVMNKIQKLISSGIVQMK